MSAERRGPAVWNFSSNQEGKDACATISPAWVQSGRLSLRFDVYSPSQVLQIASIAARCRRICRVKRSPLMSTTRPAHAVAVSSIGVGKGVSELLDVTPAQFKVLVLHRPKLLVEPARSK